MAKRIYATQDEIESILEGLKKQIQSMKCWGSIDIKKDFASDKREANIYFTAEAWNKMNALVREFDTEVQWHGCVQRISDNEFEVYDILVPPHVVTAATVTSDNQKYSEWINDLPDDVFNDLHFHGHSHVNMAVSPSGTDMKYRRDVVTQLPTPNGDDEDSFYIFFIINKRGEWSAEIYDLKNNALYATADISIDVYAGDAFLSVFISEAKKVAVKEATKTTYDYPAKSYCMDKKAEKKEKKKDDWRDQIARQFGASSCGYCDDDDDPNGPFYWRGY